MLALIPHDMDVNVELLSTEENELSRKIRLIGITTFVLSIILVLMSTSSNNENEAFSYVLWITLFIHIGARLFFLIYNRSHRTLGKLTFAIDGLTVFEGATTNFYPLSDLRNMKVSISEYAGEQKFMPFYLIVPTQKGIENFLWLDKSKLSNKFRFKIISESHYNRLTDVIREWQETYPAIEK